jgi:hypothetical protein
LISSDTPDSVEGSVELAPGIGSFFSLTVAGDAILLYKLQFLHKKPREQRATREMQGWYVPTASIIID